MGNRRVNSGGGWPAIRYSLRMGRKAGGSMRLYRALSKKNTCKTCALGMGGLAGGMRNEIGQSLQVCKKSMQAQAQDMQPPIAEQFWRDNSIEALQSLSGRELESLGRLVQPLYRKRDAKHFETLDWQAAKDLLLARWQEANPDRSFFYTSGRSCIEAAFLVQLLVRQWGTNNVNNCSYYCHQASGAGLKQSLGGGTATVMLEDLYKCDTVVLIGANPASNHPRFMTHLADLKKRGGQVIVINPFRELGLERFNIPSHPGSLLFGTKIADLYVQPHCGGDLALLQALSARLHERGASNERFLQQHTRNADAFLASMADADSATLLQQAGVETEMADAVCKRLQSGKNIIFCWAMGITHHQHGSKTVRALANLALQLGSIGRPGAGLLPLRGHSNVQGVGTVGVVPKLQPDIIEAYASELGIKVPDAPGMDTFSCMQAAQRGDIDFALLLGGNLYSSNPDLGWAKTALSQIKFKTLISTTMNKSHVIGHGEETLILPVRARDEEQETTSQESMFNYVRLSSGGMPPPDPDLPSESKLFSELGERLCGRKPVPWHTLHDHRTIRAFISKTTPALKPLTGLDDGKEFTIPGRIKHQPLFNTADGRAELAIQDAIDARPAANGFNLMTFRSEGQFNTIVYEDEDLYRGVAHRMVVFINPDDLAACGLTAGSKVLVKSTIGSLVVEAVAAPIRSGNLAMYFPEANVLVPGDVDPDSRTPAFKGVKVTLTTTTPAKSTK